MRGVSGTVCIARAVPVRMCSVKLTKKHIPPQRTRSLHGTFFFLGLTSLGVASPPWHRAPTYIHGGAERLKPYHLSLAPVSASTFHLRACAHRATEGVLVPSAQGPASSIGRHPVEREGEAPGIEPGPPSRAPPWLHRFGEG